MENSENLETDLEIVPPIDEATREGVTKGNISDILGDNFGVDEKETETSDSQPKGSETKESDSEKTQKEIFAEVKAMCYTLNFAVVTGCGLIAGMLGKKIDTSNINASDSELIRLAKVAQPVYEKYMKNMSPETLLIVTILSIYGFRVAGEFMGESEIAKNTTDEVSKAMKDKNNSWLGNKDYYQTGKKAGQLKVKK